MFSIYKTNPSRQGYSIDKINEDLINICQNHRITGKAFAFCFILYDFRAPELPKILSHDEHWISLNEISGNYISIFCMNPKEFIKEYDYQERKHRSSLLNTEKELFEHDLINKVHHPSLLFFQIDGERVTDALLVNLKEKTTEPLFKEVQDYITVAVNALKHIKPENSSNSKEIFTLLETEINARKSAKAIKSIVGYIPIIKFFASLID